MADFIAAEIVKATGGRLVAGAESTACSGIATDSRAVKPGQCFVALRGERFDGHDFVADALNAGAVGAIVAQVSGKPRDPAGGAFIVLVDDTLKALGALAGFHRRRFRIPVVGITGSTGKTTTKDMTAAILSRRGPVAATAENFNNEIGVPLGVLVLGPEHRAAVIEMAMRGAGEIAYLTSIAAPTIGVITNVGLSHLERLGTPEAIADAKGELVAAVGEGAAVLNADDPFFDRLASLARGRVVRFGVGANAEVRASDIVSGDDATSFRLTSPSGEAQVALHTPGRHQVINALAAGAAAMEAGAGVDDVVAGLQAFAPAGGRAQVVASRRGFRILNDCYNASPASMEAALDLLADLGDRHKIAVLGDMLELGPAAPELHRAVGERAAEAGVDLLIAVGDLARRIADGAAAVMPPDRVRWTSSNDEAASWALSALEPGDVVLVKASRAMAFEQITRRLAGD